MNEGLLKFGFVGVIAYGLLTAKSLSNSSQSDGNKTPSLGGAEKATFLTIPEPLSIGSTPDEGFLTGDGSNDINAFDNDAFGSFPDYEGGSDSPDIGESYSQINQVSPIGARISNSILGGWFGKNILGYKTLNENAYTTTGMDTRVVDDYGNVRDISTTTVQVDSKTFTREGKTVTNVATPIRYAKDNYSGSETQDFLNTDGSVDFSIDGGDSDGSEGTGGDVGSGGTDTGTGSGDVDSGTY